MPNQCAAEGGFSALAASLLLGHGVRAAIHVADGGVGTWGRRGWPLEQAERQHA